MKRTYLLFIILSAFCSRSFASIDTINIYSTTMFKNVKCVVITPSKIKPREVLEFEKKVGKKKVKVIDGSTY